jgi:superfamily II DNA or RNA helicase
MARASISIGNARSSVAGLEPEIFRLLSHELAYPVGEPGTQQWVQRDGSVKLTYWDGYKRLMSKKGVFPSGLVPRAARLLSKWGVRFEVNDMRHAPLEAVPLWKLPDGFQLRDYQLAACDAAMELKRGVIDSPPRTGKTVMIAELVRRVSEPTVITAPTDPIASQTYQRLLDLFAQNDWAGALDDCSADFYLLKGGKPKSRAARAAVKRAKVFVATAATAVGMPQSWWDRIQCLIVDERHHQAARTYHEINDLAVNAYYRWGFTGTDYRSKAGEQVALEACLGRTVARFSIREMIERGVLVQGRVQFVPIDGVRGLRSAKFADAYQRGVVELGVRNQLVKHYAQRYEAEGRRVLVLVHRIEHGELLERMIPGSRFVKGGDDDVRDAVRDLDEGKLRCLIGSPVVGEGLDCPSADVLVYAKGFKARVTHTQDTFRVLTNDRVKPGALIIDFVDRQSSKLLDHSIERMRNYLAMGIPCELIDAPEVDGSQTALL